MAPGVTSTRAARSCDHLVQVCADEAFVARVVADYMGTALGRGDGAVVIATPEHSRAFTARLAHSGADVAAALAAGQLLVLDAEHTLARVMIDGRPDRDAFREVLGAALDPVRAAGHRTIRLYGEMVDLLWQRQLEAALQLEELWNELLVDERLSLLCVYRIDPLDRQAHGLLRRVTHCHARLLPGEDPERFAAAVDRAYADVFGTSGDVATLRDLMISRLAPEPDLPAGHAALLALDEMPALLANDIRARARLHYRRAPHGSASPRR